MPFVLCAPVVGCGAGSDLPTGAASAITQGTADPGDPSVVGVVVQVPAGSSNATFCTGSVVSPHVVLTAAHCLSPDHVGANPGFLVYLKNNLWASPDNARPANYAHVKEVHFHTQYNEAASVAAISAGDPSQALYDIGVIITSTAIQSPPIAMKRTVLDSLSVGASFRNVGFGRTNPRDNLSDGVKTQAPATLRSISPDLLFLDDGAQNICAGDSGGPSLLMQDGHEVIAGVHSWVPHGATCTGGQYDTRVDVYAASFVDPFIEIADPGFLPPPDMSPTAPDAGTGRSAGGCSLIRSSDDRAPGHEAAPVFLATVALVLVVRRKVGGPAEERACARPGTGRSGRASSPTG